jgi:outer membrane protein assembly factor BamA
MGTHQHTATRRPLIGTLALVASFALAHCAQADVSYIPIPEITTDPNEGNTFGLLGVALITDETDRVTYMIAPDVRYNQTKGIFATFRLFGYPDPKSDYAITIGKSTTKDEDYELEYHNVGLLKGKAFFHGIAVYERDSTERFYGFGNDSSEFAEANYTGANFRAEFNPGYFVLPHLSLGYKMRIRRLEVQRGQVDSAKVTDLVRCFRPHPAGVCPPSGDTPGLGKNDRRLPDIRSVDFGPDVYWAHRVALAYDTRDFVNLPTEGSYTNFYVEAADQRLGSARSFVKFGAEWQAFIPLRVSKNPILALRGLLDYTSGDRELPFWEQQDLGGRRRLRGFGSNRFIDFNRSLATAELRTKVYQRHIFGVNAELEITPFVEAGQVFRHLDQSPISDLHWVGGLGFRGVVRPQIVGFVDIGRGSEGLAIFTGINYPF